jgi:predicted RNase H-like nuclease (RuvC/YqgF family)
MTDYEAAFWKLQNNWHESVKHYEDRIEKLEAEVERLVKSRNKWGKLYNQTLEKLRLSVMSDSEYVKIIDEKCAEQADRIEKLEAALQRANANVEEYERKFYLGTDRIEKLEAALDDMAQYVSRADWHYLKDETCKALEGKND